MIKKTIFTFSALILLSSCTSTPLQKTGLLPQLTYEHLSEVPVKVRKIEFASLQQRGTQAWDIANELPTPPDVALRRYIKERFKPVSGSGLLNINLTKAQITKQSIPNENKILSYFDIADNEDYVLEVILDVESLYQSGLPDSQKTLRFVRKTRMPLNVTMAYREARLQRTIEGIVRDIDEILIQTLSDELGLISSRNKPKLAIEVKTATPEVQTKIGETIKNVSDNARAAGRAVARDLSGDSNSAKTVE